MSTRLSTDVLIIGSGAAGLACAVAARGHGRGVTVVSRGPAGRGSSTAVAGGILNAPLALFDPADCVEDHVRDTVEAGRYVNEEPQVQAMAEGMLRAVPWLEACGVQFLKEDGRLLQIRAAGHRRPRSLVLANHRGTTLADPLLGRARATGVEFLSGLVAVELLLHDGAAVGAVFLDPRSLELVTVLAGTTVLATGGAGLFYESTGIPPLTPGDGYALAYQAGCSLIDLEFVQFFPTALVGENFPHRLLPYDYLLSHGAVFRNSRGEDIAARHDLPEPAMITRSQLAGAIGREILAGNDVEGAVLLDCTGFRPDFDDFFFRRHRFSDFILRARSRGRDVLAEPLRVAPIVHHFMGGVRVSVRGETDVRGLLACGEVAGGTHGANRLAGNAFAEALSSGFRAGELAGTMGGSPTAVEPDPLEQRVSARIHERVNRRSDVRVDEVVAALRRTLSQGAGICRDGAALEAAQSRLKTLATEAEGAEAVEISERALAPNLGGLIGVARMLVESALLREESRGAHVRADFVAEDDRFLHHFAHSAGSGAPHTVPVARIGRDWWREFGSGPTSGDPTAATFDQE